MWPNGRRYYSFKQFLKDRSITNTYKLVIDAGFSCPVIDGTLSTKGCTYCNNAAFSPATVRRHLSVTQQVKHEINLARQRYNATHFLAYFQSYSNTHAPVERLRELYDEALSVDPDVIGICIGTHPACVADDVLDLLEEYARDYHVWLELGLQSAHDSTLKRINRGHDYACFKDAVHRAAGRGFYISAHLILGFPWETPEMECETLTRVAELPIDGVKLHHLHVVRGTELYREFSSGQWPALEHNSADDHVRRVCDALENLPPHICLQRWCGEVDGPTLVAPCWNIKKLSLLRKIEKELERRGTCQGNRWKNTKTDVDPILEGDRLN